MSVLRIKRSFWEAWSNDPEPRGKKVFLPKPVKWELMRNSFPDASDLQGEPSQGALSSLEYECSTCARKMGSVENLKSHVDGKAHKQKMAAANLEESPTVVEQMEEFSGHEARHRSLNLPSILLR
jgi:hypothetical protein